MNGNQSAATNSVTVQTDGTLSGSGIVGGATTLQGTLAPGSSVGTLTFSSDVSLAAGSTTVVEVSKSPFTNDVIRVLGNLSYGGTLTVVTNGVGFAVGDTFRIFDAPAYPLTGFNALQLPVLPAGLAWDASGLTNNGSIAVVGVPVPKDLVWKGDGAGNVWDLALTPNWLYGTNLSVFTNLDTVTFDDTGSNQVPVTLVGVLAPVAMTVDAAINYTLGGTGWLAGSMPLTKAGTGTLTINTTNMFSSPATLTLGTVVLGNGSALGSGAVGLAGGTLQLHRNGTLANALQVTASSTVTNNGNCTLNGTLGGSNVLSLGITSGSVITLGGSASAFSGTISLGSSPGGLRFNQGGNPWGAANATLDAGTAGIINNRLTGGGTVYLGALDGGSGAKLRGSDQSSNPGSLNTYVTGGTGRDAVFAGAIQDTAHLVAITKLGGGTWTLAGTNAYSGPTRVGEGSLALAGTITTTNSVVVSNAATLHLSGTLTASVLEIQAGGTLTGCGTLNAVLVNNGLVLSDCGAPGVLTLTGNVTNNGTMRLVSGTALASTNLFVNNGVLDMMTAGSGLPPNLVNNGVILDSGSLPAQVIFMAGSAVKIRVQSYTGHQYQLQRASSLTTPSWVDVGLAQAGNGAVLEFTDPDSAAGTRFYRIQVWP